MSDYLVYIGTYAKADEPGIHVYRLDMSSGALSSVSSIDGIDAPSFVAIAPDHRHLYAIGETSEVNGTPGGAVAAFSIDPQTGALAHINTQSSIGGGPCHIDIDPTGRYAFVANYGGGSVAVLPINADGSLGEATDFVQHEGSSVDPARQKEPHAHSFFVAPNGKYALAPDLGLDKIMVYAIDHDSGKLTAQEPGRVEPGQGPRHLAYHPGNGRLYVINEMGNTITAFDFDQDSGVMTRGQTISTLPDGYAETSHTADIHVHPNGKFVYGSNRGHDSIAVYAVLDNGDLETIEIVPTGGQGPRNFGLDPTGAYLIVGGGGSNDIITFSVDSDSGKLTPTGHRVEVPSPVCHKFVPAP